MCGIAGIWNRRDGAPAERSTLAAMAGALRHRGPDAFGYYVDGALGLSHARLSIIDLVAGSQPMGNDDGSVWLTYNGEIYNYLELRERLEALGWVFRTHSDTEVLLRAYEQWPDDFLEHLNGNFAFGLWDARLQRLLLARDRMGIRPLFWSERDGSLLFASEIKALLAAGVDPRFDPRGLDQVFVAWTTVAPQTVVQGVFELPPGHLMVVRSEGEPVVRSYWDLPPPPPREQRLCDPERAAEELRALLEDSVRLRLRADVTVGAYLSGGLDSTIATALVREVTDTPLETYSIVFSDAEYDESAEQRQAVAALGTEHFQVEVDYETIARAFEQVVLMADKPILRTAPVPLFLLSGLVRQRSRKVVLTGEGADELFGGYDIFKETKIRAWWGRRPESRMRPLLLRKLYPFAPGASQRAAAFFEAFYREGIDDPEDLGFSHRPTWRNGLKNRGFFSARLREALADHDVPAGIVQRFAPALAARDPLARAEYLEARVFLAGHLLASQGDRMSLGHSVEGRYPFLDHRLVEWSSRLDPRLKLRGLQEKWILRQAHEDLLPESLLQRHKRPYIAPNTRTFREGFGRRLAEELLSEENVLREGLFDPGRIARLRRKALSPAPLGERETMALIGVLSTHSLARSWRGWQPEPVADEDFPLRRLSAEEKKA